MPTCLSGICWQGKDGAATTVLGHGIGWRCPEAPAYSMPTFSSVPFPVYGVLTQNDSCFSEVWWTLSCGPACQTPWHAHMLPANAGKSGRLAALPRQGSVHHTFSLSAIRLSTLSFHQRCSFGSHSGPSPKATLELRTDHQDERW